MDGILYVYENASEPVLNSESYPQLFLFTPKEKEWNLWSSRTIVLFFTFQIFTPFIFFFPSLQTPLFGDMNISKAEGKRSMKDRVNEDAVKEDEEDEDAEDDNKKKRVMTHSSRKGSGGSTQPCCQVENCMSNMNDAKTYHRRHKVCEFHAKATIVLVAGVQQRFCQQCSRFHELSEFDDAKRSCRRRLLGHNERRRKSSYDFQGEGSG